MFYKGGPIYHCKHVPVPVAQYSSETEYNAACNAGMSIAHSIILNNKMLNKDPDVVPKQAPLILLDIKPSVCMTNNSKDTKHISRRMYSVRNYKECNLHKIVWCDEGPKLADIGTKNVRDDELNPGL